MKTKLLTIIGLLVLATAALFSQQEYPAPATAEFRRLVDVNNPSLATTTEPELNYKVAFSSINHAGQQTRWLIVKGDTTVIDPNYVYAPAGTKIVTFRKPTIEERPNGYWTITFDDEPYAK